MGTIKYPEPKQEYKVLVRTITYNQAKYILDTLNGVAMQQTNFPFVEVVIDDCSTDGEQDEIKSWLGANCDMENAEYIDIPTSQVIIARHKTNSNCTFAIYLLKRNLWKEQEEKRKHFKPWENKCEYIALCEGDDYWTDPLKLQKQVDLLDAHPKCMLTYHAFNYHYENEKKGKDHIKNVELEYIGADIFKGVQFQTATTMFRKEVIESILFKKLSSMGFSFGDFLLFLSASEMGRLMGINEVMSVYRVHAQGLSAQVLSKYDVRMKSVELWIKAYNLFGDKNRKALLEITILPGVAAALFNLVLFRHIPFSRWLKAYISACKIYPPSLIRIPYLFTKHIFILVSNKISNMI